jgi:Ca-activated chloride channel family protein
MVSEYRLVGYETRSLRRQDFNNDKVDAGDIGSGHTVTAIYEITPKGVKQSVDALRYKQAVPKKATSETATHGNEYGFLKMRYKLPKQDKSKLISVAITRDLEKSALADVPDDVRFATSVAAFGQKLRKESWIADYAYDDILKMATAARGTDTFGYRSAFLSLVRLAKSLSGDEPKPASKQDR